MELTFNIIHDSDTLTFDNQEYVKDANNPYRFVAVNTFTTINHLAFHRCLSLIQVVIPDSVISIGDNVFRDCYFLTHIVIPDSVTSIGIYAFYWCTSLTHMVIPASLTHIGNWAFDCCMSLTKVETDDVNAYIIEYCKTYYPSVEVVVNSSSYVLK